MQNDASNSGTAPRDIFPLVRNTERGDSIQDVFDALNNLHNRLSAIEAHSGKPDPMDASFVSDPNAIPFTAGDRAVIDEVGAFLGIHRVVANTVASEAQPDIDPVTNLPRVVVDRQNAAMQQPGGFSSFQTPTGPGA